MDPKVNRVVLPVLRKALNTVHHGILLKKLNKFSSHPISFNELRNYLNDRRQAGKHASSRSSYSVVEYGVRQGPMLGPALILLLFASMIYTSDGLDKG